MMNVDKLEGAALALAVAQCVGDVSVHDTDPPYYYGPPLTWERCGPIIERERINLRFDIPPDLYNEYGDQPPYPIAWFARSRGIDVKGPTPLIAAMRAFVASKKT